MSRSDQQLLYYRIRNAMWYWGCRILLELPSVESHRYESKATRRLWETAMKRRRYRRLRAQGMTGYEAMATMRGQTVERVRAESIQRSRDYRAQWGGDPSHMGSDAWKRRTLAAHGTTLEGDPYRGPRPRSWGAPGDS